MNDMCIVYITCRVPSLVPFPTLIQQRTLGVYSSNIQVAFSEHIQ
jgi:hypothetical protein